MLGRCHIFQSSDTCSHGWYTWKQRRRPLQSFVFQLKLIIFPGIAAVVGSSFFTIREWVCVCVCVSLFVRIIDTFSWNLCTSFGAYSPLKIVNLCVSLSSCSLVSSHPLSFFVVLLLLLTSTSDACYIHLVICSCSWSSSWFLNALRSHYDLLKTDNSIVSKALQSDFHPRNWMELFPFTGIAISVILYVTF